MTKFTIQYRYLGNPLVQGLTLKELLIRCMRAQRDGVEIGASAKARIIDLDQDGGYVILNKITERAGWDRQVFGGQLIQLQQGADVAAVVQSLDEDTDEYLLQQVNIGEGARVLKGIVYFAVVGNHVGLVEDQQVKGRTLERYLTALLQKLDVIEPGKMLALDADFRAADGKEVQASAEITVTAEPSRRAPPAAVDEIVQDEVARLTREGATVLDVLRTLGWNEEAIAALEDEVPDGGSLEGFFKFFIKKGRKKKPITRATINHAFRNIDDDDIGLKGDGIERGGMVRLNTTKDIATIRSLKDPADALQKIVEALKEWALAGKIDCRFED